MKLFNSLGSNYDRSDITAALVGHGRGATLALTEYLAERYGGPTMLTYKGREALVLALGSSDMPKGSSVAITGFTCYAVYKAVTTAGHRPHYLDIDPDRLDSGAAELERAIKADSKIKAVVVQNSLGYPADIAPIERLCQQHKLTLIEDLAHSVGAHYPDGREVGSVGDLVMLSFGRDKLIDAVSGGALVARNPRFLLPDHVLGAAPALARLRDRLYPLLAADVRGGYQIGIGQIVHQAFKVTGLLSRAVDAEYYEGHGLSGWQAQLALRRYHQLERQLTHRHQIARLYAERLDPALLIPGATDQIDRASNLRFAITTDDRADLLRYLASRGAYLADTWYDAAIAPARYLASTDYHGQCPNADDLAGRIVNLPTHRTVTPARAKQLTEWINQWQQSR